MEEGDEGRGDGTEHVEAAIGVELWRFPAVDEDEGDDDNDGDEEEEEGAGSACPWGIVMGGDDEGVDTEEEEEEAEILDRDPEGEREFDDRLGEEVEPSGEVDDSCCCCG